MKKMVLVLVTLLTLPLMAAEKRIDERRTIDSDADLQIELIGGDIEVIAGKSDELIVRGTINDEYEKFSISGDSDDITIEVEPKEKRQRRAKFNAQLTITVPAGIDLTIESVSGRVTLEGLSNVAEIESVSGSVDVSGPLQELDIEAVSGNIEIDAESTLKSAVIEVVSAKIEMRGDYHPSAEYSIEAVSGEITFVAPRGWGARYEIETFSGVINNEFGPDPEKAEFLPSQTLSFEEGGGRAQVDIHCFSGKVHLLED